MLVQQISVFLENKKGRLSEVTNILRDNDIDISAVSIADTTNFGILRMIVNKPEFAVEKLKESGLTVNTTKVLAVEVPDKPGGLANVLELLKNADISIEYLYSFVKNAKESALILFRVDNSKEAVKVLKDNNVRVLDKDEVYGL